MNSMGPKAKALLVGCSKVRISEIADSALELMVGKYEAEVVVAFAACLAGAIKESASQERRTMLRDVVIEILDTISPQEAQKEQRGEEG